MRLIGPSPIHESPVLLLCFLFRVVPARDNFYGFDATA